MSALVIAAARLIDGTGAPPLAPACVLVEDGRVVAVGPDLRVPGAERLDLGAATLLPGLIDLHVHLSDEGLPDASAQAADPPEAWLARMAAHAAATLLAGVTTVRDVGGRHHQEFALRRSGAPAPRLVLAGRIVSAPTPGASSWPGMYREARGERELVRAVEEQCEAGADVIKVMATGAVLAPGSERPDEAQLTLDELRAVVRAAGRAGRRVAAHAHGIEGLRRAVRAGVHTIEHGTDLHRDPAVAREMRERGTHLVPTLKALALIADGAGVPADMAAKARERRQDRDATFRLALEAGVPIAMGTDAATPYNHHGENAQELGLMVALGMGPAAAIVAATSAAARALGRDDVGRIAPGCLADLAAWDGDVLGDVRALERPPRLVMLGGRVVAGG